MKGRRRLAARAWAHLTYRPSPRRLRLHPLHREVASLEAEQWRPAAEVRAAQVARLVQTVALAVDRVPYYRKQAGGGAAGLRLPADLEQLPTLSRGSLAAARHELLTSGRLPRGAQWNHTGGSTGEPVSFLQEDDYRIANLAAVVRHDRWAGWDFGLATALLWGADRDLAAAQPWRQRLENRWLRRQVELDAFNMGRDEMLTFSRRLQRLRPVVLRGYASALEIYALHLEENGRPFPPPAGIISCAETLTDVARQRLEQVFQAPVFDRYGSREFGLIASQCAAGSYHLNTRGVWVEVLDGERPAMPGACGRVVVTGLVARAMPLLRYETGDVAEAATATACTCGRGLPLLGRVHGRVSDFISAVDGRLIHGEFFTHLFYGRDCIRSFSVAQDESGAVTLFVVGEGESLEQQVGEVLDAMRRRLGEQAVIHCRRVDSLSRGPSGKRCFVRSAIAAARWQAGGVRRQETAP